MALNDILDAIRAESDSEIRAVEAAAEKEVATLLDAARRDAGSEEERLAHSRDAAAQRHFDRIVNRARLEADRSYRAAIEALYLEAREATSAALRELRGGPRYRAVLTQFIDEARAALPEATTLRVHPEDEEYISEVTAHAGFQIEADLGDTGGVQLADESGRVAHNTFDSRLERADGALRIEFARMITAEGAE